MLCTNLKSQIKLKFLAATIFSFVANIVIAQSIYKIVDEQGRITFTDVPKLLPESQTRSQTRPVVSIEKSSDALTSADSTRATLASSVEKLSPEIQLVVGRYPVRLFTNSNCEKCLTAKALLVSRGIPFAETLVLIASDLDKATDNVGATTLPVLTIGSHVLKEYSSKDWHSYLDAAGYSKTSALPLGYKNPPPVLWKTPASLPIPNQTNQQTSPQTDPSLPYPVIPQPQLIPLPTANNPNNIVF